MNGLDIQETDIASHNEEIHSDLLFVYGALKPGEIGYEQIEKYIESHTNGYIRGYRLYVRDTLPIVSQIDGAQDFVEGHILKVSQSHLRTFWETVKTYEGTSNYRLEENVLAQNDQGDFLVSVFVGRNLRQGHPEVLNQPWTSFRDPIFATSFPLLHAQIGSRKPIRVTGDDNEIAYWKQLNPLLSEYLLLISILEHLTSVKFGGSAKQNPSDRNRKLSNSQKFVNAFTFALEGGHIPAIHVSDSRNIETRTNNLEVSRALNAWYMVRSNLQHRGKRSFFDAQLVLDASIGLSNLILAYLEMEIPEIGVRWQECLGYRLEFISVNS